MPTISTVSGLTTSSSVTGIFFISEKFYVKTLVDQRGIDQIIHPKSNYPEGNFFL